MTDTEKDKRNEMGPDVNYLKPDILETTNRILLDIEHIIKSESTGSENNHPIKTAGYYFNKNTRTFHSHLVLGKRPWLEKGSELSEYANLPLRTDEFLSGLLYSALCDRSLLPNDIRNELALLTADVDLDEEKGFPTILTPWLWDKTYRSLKNNQISLPNRPQLPGTGASSRIEKWKKLAQRFYLTELQHDLDKESIGPSTSGRCLLLVPIFDIWDAGQGSGGIWGVLVCSFSNDAGRRSYLEGLQTNQLLDLLLEVERLGEEYFEAGLAKIVKAKITPPYDWIELFVKRLHWIQDWDRVTVLDGDQIKYCYRHRQPAEDDFMWVWDRCENKQGRNCDECRQNKPDKPVFRWSSIDRPSATEHCILNNHLIKEIDPSEEAAVRSIDIEFEFPASSVVRQSANGEIDRPSRLAIARQHIAVLRTLLPIVRTRRAALRSAVSAIMGRNMSHNIGSHVLARYSSKIRLDSTPDPGRPDHRGDFLAYLQRRMDFLAEVATSDKAFWSQPLSLKEQLERLNYGEQKKRFENQHNCSHIKMCTHHLSPNGHQWTAGSPILLSFVTGKESLLASVEYGKPEKCDAIKPTPDGCNAAYFPGKQEDFWFACPGGEVGVHALYVVLENIIRNSARHGTTSNDTVRLFVGVGNKNDNTELLTVEIIDPRTKLDLDGCPLVVKENDTLERKYSIDKINEEIKELGSKRSLVDKNGKRQRLLRLPAEINSILESEPFLDANGGPNPHYWGVREIQICAHYLRDNPLSDLEGKPDETFPVLKADCHELPDGSFCLMYKLYLQRAKLMAAVVKHRDKAWGNDADLRRKGVLLINAGTNGIPDWKEIASKTVGYSFLVIDEGIAAPTNETDYAILPTRTVQPEDFGKIVGRVCSDNGIVWMEPLHRHLAKHYRDRRDAWKGKPIWGVAVQGGDGESLYGPISELPLIQKDGLFRVAKGTDGGKVLPLPDSICDWHKRLENSYIAAAWVDHPNPDDFLNRGGAKLVQSYMCQVDYVRRWISVEGAFSDSPHAAYLNLPPDNGWEILAASIPRVAVLDERVQSEHARTIREINLGSIVWPAMGVWVPNKKDCDLDIPDINKCQEFLRKPSAREDQYPIDFLILHLTVLERLAKALDQPLPRTLSDLISQTFTNEKYKPTVIIVTGRGVPTVASSMENDHLDNVRYLPISVLLECLVTRPSKLVLMRAIWSASKPRLNH